MRNGSGGFSFVLAMGLADGVYPPPPCAILWSARAGAATKEAMAKPLAPHDNLLSVLPPELAAALFATARPHRLKADQTLFTAGDPGDGCYRVEQGLLKVSVVSPSGGERILAILGPGSLVGEFAMLDAQPRSASVTAARDSELSFISRKSFEIGRASCRERV